MLHGRIHEFYQSQLTEMPDQWKRVLAIIKPIFLFDAHELISVVLKIKYNIFSTVKIKDEN